MKRQGRGVRGRVEVKYISWGAGSIVICFFSPLFLHPKKEKGFFFVLCVKTQFAESSFDS